MASSSGNDDDLTIPRAAINKMIKETLPNVRVANDARELVVNCCTEFIHLISSEANEICNKSEKKTISPEHVIQGESAGAGLELSAVSGPSLRTSPPVSAVHDQVTGALASRGCTPSASEGGRACPLGDGEGGSVVSIRSHGSQSSPTLPAPSYTWRMTSEKCSLRKLRQKLEAGVLAPLSHPTCSAVSLCDHRNNLMLLKVKFIAG